MLALVRYLCRDEKECYLERQFDIEILILFFDGFKRGLPEDLTDCTEDQLKRVRYHVIEFVVNCRSQKTNKEVMPSKMKGYVLGIQRGFADKWGDKLKLLSGPVF